MSPEKNISIQTKIALTGGKDFWRLHAVPEDSLDSIMVADGPHGLRKQDLSASDHMGVGGSEPATCFPPAVALASTWDRALVEEVATALGQEAKAQQVAVVLGPGMNLKRDPRCGRNFEYFSEDPYLTGELASAFVAGVQSQGVGTSPKHFAANNQETDRMRRDSQLDERTLREVYLAAFRKVVTQQQPWTVMCSYNRINGVHASQHHWLLTEVLKNEWGFTGLVVSDWGAVWDRVKALQAGLDLEMPASPHHEAAVLAAYDRGEIDETTIDAAYQRVARIVRLAMQHADPSATFDAEAHHQLARRAAQQAIVLLENDGILPLNPRHEVVVIGEFARTARYQGAGSSRVNPTRLDNALDRICELAGQQVAFEPGFSTNPKQPAAPDAHAKAVALAASGKTVLLFLGLGEAHESEGYDREHIGLPEEQLALLADILAVNSDVIVVLSNGAAVELPFAGQVRAIVEGWLLGQAGGPALADVLYGLVNPSGKLAETIALRLADAPSYLNFPGDTTGVRYGEGIFVGYRGYDAMQRDVAFPFGHGLSYTTFSYAPPKVTANGNEIHVEVEVTNTGKCRGREVVQVYLGVPESAVTRPLRELKGFASVTLDPGASDTAVITIPAQELAYWSVADGRFVIEAGRYEVFVGSSSRDLRGTGSVELSGDEPRRLLTLESSMKEALANPAFKQATKDLLAHSMFAGDDSLGVDPDKLMGDFPLAGFISFSGIEPHEFQQLLDQINQQS